MEYQGGSFDLVQTGDPESLLRTRAKEFEIGLKPVEDQAESDLRRKTELDMNKYQDLIQFSDKLKTTVEGIASDHIKNQRALGLKKLSEHNAKFPEESKRLIKEQNELEEIALDNEVQTQKLAADLEKKGTSFFVTDEFKKMSPYAQNAAIKGYADQQIVIYQTNFPVLKDYTTLEGYQGAVNKYETEYLAQFSDLTDANYKKSFLEKHVFAPVRKINSKKRAEWEAGVKEEAKNIEIANRNEDYRNSLRNYEVSNETGLATMIQNQAKSILHHHNGDISAAHAEVVAQTLKAIKAGGVSTDLIKTLNDPKKGLIQHSSSKEKQLYSKIFKEEYDLLRKAALEKDTNDLNELNQEKDGKALNIINDTHAAIAAKDFKIPTGELNEKGEPVMMSTDQVSYLNYQNSEYSKLKGHTSHIIDDILKVVDPSITKDEFAIRDLKRYEKLGLLTTDMLTSDKVSETVRTMFWEKAVKQEENNRQFVGSEVFTTKAKSYFKSSANLDPSVDIFGAKAEARYQQILRAKLAANPDMDFDTANKWALEDTLKWMDEQVSSKGLKKGRNGFSLDKLNNVNLDFDLGSKEENRAYKLINDVVHSLGFDALTVPNEEGDSYFATKDELEKWSKGWGTGAWKPNGSLLYLAEIYGTTPSQILNTLRETAGLGKAKSPHSIMQIESIQDLSDRRALLTNPKNTDIAARATHAVIDPNPDEEGDEFIKELIPNANAYEMAINQYEVATGDEFNLGEPVEITPENRGRVSEGETTGSDVEKLIPYIALSDQLVKQGFSRIDMLTPGTEAFKELQKTAAVTCINPLIKDYIINTHLLNKGIISKDMVNSEEYYSLMNDVEFLKATGRWNGSPLPDIKNIK